MNKAKMKALEAAGYRVGNAEDFLELTDDERQLVELRLKLSRAIRTKRTVAHLTQKDVAQRLGSTQSRVAKIEAGDAGVSLDQSFRAYFAVEGTIGELVKLYPVENPRPSYTAPIPEPTVRRPKPTVRRKISKSKV